MKMAIEVKRGVLMSTDGLRMFRVLEAPPGVFILQADYAIGTIFELARGEEEEIWGLYDQVLDEVMPAAETTSSPAEPSNRKKKSWAEVSGEGQK